MDKNEMFGFCDVAISRQTSEKELFENIINGFQPLFTQNAPFQIFD